MDINLDNCRCDELNKCNRYCPIKVGRNIWNFIKNIECVDTKIGEMTHSNRGGDGLISGHIECNKEAPIDLIFEDINGIDISGKFKAYNDRSAQWYIGKLLDYLGVTGENRDKLMSAVKRFNSNAKMPMMLKVGSVCNVINKDGKKVEKCTLHMVRWAVANGNCSLQYIFTTDRKFIESGNSTIIVDSEEYQDRIFTSADNQTSCLDKQLIKITNYGLVRPIEFSDGKVTIAIDSQNVYRIGSNGADVIGEWDGAKIKSVRSGLQAIKNSSAYEKMQKHIKYINAYRKYIIPYGIVDSNKIKC